MEKYKDAYGRAIYDYYQGNGGYEIVENDIGDIRISTGPSNYFREYKDWPQSERKAIRFARGKVVDIGCGAGRVTLYLQEQGFDAFGIDNSPLAIKVCKQRGVKKVKVMSVTQLSRRQGLFDTIVMFGNNFGLFANQTRAKWLLRRFYNITSSQGRIIAQSLDPYDTNDSELLAYQKFNRTRGRMSGQVRMRVRYKKYMSDWFEYLLVSRNEMQQLLKGSGWKVKQFIDSKGPSYMVIIQKEE